MRTASDRPTPRVPGDGVGMGTPQGFDFDFFEAYTRSPVIGGTLPVKFSIKVICCGLRREPLGMPAPHWWRARLIAQRRDQSIKKHSS
jgi:hypothetical protein